MSNIEAILFDFGGTLDHDGLDWFDRFYRALLQKDSTIDRSVFQDHSNWISRHIGTLPDTAALSMPGIVARLHDFLHQRLSNGAGLAPWDPADLVANFVRESEGYLARNLNVLRQLKRHYRIGVISNNWGNAAGWCHDYGYADLCECMIDSTVVKSSKPDSRIFQIALDHMKLPADRCAYVGDKFEADVVGAAKVGMTPIWVVGHEPKDCPDESLVRHRIRQLTDLPNLIPL